MVQDRVDGRAWTQRFTAVDVADDALAVAGLQPTGTLDHEGTWVVLRGSSAGS